MTDTLSIFASCGHPVSFSIRHLVLFSSWFLVYNFFKGVETEEYGPQSRGAWLLNPRAPHAGHIIDISLCRGLEEIFKGKDVLDLGAGIGHYGRCLLHIKGPMFPESPDVDRSFSR